MEGFMNIRLLTLTALLSTSTAMAGENKIYNVNGQEYEGYWAKTSEKAPLVLLIHDWDGLTDYEKKELKC